jgi:hypothetical protein
MAKKSTKVAFSKANITFENGKYTITEITKDDSTDYDLSAVLDSFIGQEGISLSISTDDDMPAVTEE